MIIEQSSQTSVHRLRSASVISGGPDRVMIELTYRCNFRCGYCYIPRERCRTPEMSLTAIQRMLAELSRCGCAVVGFTGGEPFMRRDILEIITCAKRCGLEVVVHTNASLIDARMCRELSRLRLNKVDVSLNALDRETFERISGVKGSFRKVMCSLSRLARSGVPLGIKTCLLSSNAGQIGRIRDFSSSLGAFHRLDTKIFRRLDGDPVPVASCVYGASPAGSFESGPVTMKKADFLRCGIGRTQAAVTPDGRLKWCLLIDHPRIPVCRSFSRAWMRQKELFDAQVAQGRFRCGRCGVLAGCSPCPAYGWLYKRDFFACPPESRQRARFLMGDA